MRLRLVINLEVYRLNPPARLCAGFFLLSTQSRYIIAGEMRRARLVRYDGHIRIRQEITMKIGKAKPKGVAGYTPPRKRGDKDKPATYTFGRPSNYRPEYCQAIVEYFSIPVSWEKHVTEKGAAQILPMNKLPTFERWAADMGVGEKTLHDWCAKYPEFAEAYASAKSLQKAFLMELGAAGVGNHTLALMLRTNHGMKEEKEVSPADDLAEQLLELIGKMPS